MMPSNHDIIFIIFLMVLFRQSEGKVICSPDQINDSCQWNLFGWDTYHSCGYKQKMRDHLCIIKNLDGSKSTFLIKINAFLTDSYCFEFKYLTTDSVIDTCMYFYGKTMANTTNQSRLFSTFCIPNKQSELIWYSFIVSLPENITMINVVTESHGITSNHSLIIKDLSIQQCDQVILTASTSLNTRPFILKKTFRMRYQWALIIGILTLLIVSFISIIIIRHITHQILHEESTVTERIQISSVNLSQHFYEEPISIILQPPIDISVYDHVRDNYV